MNKDNNAANQQFIGKSRLNGLLELLRIWQGKMCSRLLGCIFTQQRKVRRTSRCFKKNLNRSKLIPGKSSGVYIFCAESTRYQTFEDWTKVLERMRDDLYSLCSDHQLYNVFYEKMCVFVVEEEKLTKSRIWEKGGVYRRSKTTLGLDILIMWYPKNVPTLGKTVGRNFLKFAKFDLRLISEHFGGWWCKITGKLAIFHCELEPLNWISFPSQKYFFFQGHSKCWENI